MRVTIYQGNDPPPQVAQVTIVIDVLRAFSVAHHAFIQGAKQIMLVPTVEEALQAKEQHPEFLLVGEINGLPIEGFDFGNSPKEIQTSDITNETIVQKTTNGVRAALNCLDSKHIFVTGFSNAKTTATFIRDHFLNHSSINIIASHPKDDDDFACAEYMKSIITDTNAVKSKDVIRRIIHATAAQKFFDKIQKEFDPEDIEICTKEISSDFVMKVNSTEKTPTIERVSI